MLSAKNAKGYLGCIGKDKYGDILSKCAKNDGEVTVLLNEIHFDSSINKNVNEMFPFEIYK